MIETDSRYSSFECRDPIKTQPSGIDERVRGSVPDQLPLFLYRLRDESPLAGSSWSDQLSLALANRS